MSSKWTNAARFWLWQATWRAIGEAHWFLARHPDVRPWDVSGLFHAAMLVEHAHVATERHAEDDRVIRSAIEAA